MSCLSLAKKLQPAKKAWKSFTNTLQSKLHKLKKSKAIKRTTRLLIALRSVHHPIVSYKRRALDRHRFSTLPHNHHNLHDHHQEPPQKSAATIYVDELFEETVSVHANHPHDPGDTNKAKEMNAANGAVNKAKAKADTASMTTRRQQQQPMSTVGIKVFDEKVKPRKSKASEKSAFDVDDAWKAIIASSPQLRGVDERAEEFISKFHEEMKLQKEKSILDFEEMLARSA